MPPVLMRQSSVAVELQFILPGISLGQIVRSQQQHRLDEGGFSFAGWHLRSSEHLIHAVLVRVVTLEASIRLANNGHL